MLPDWSRTLEHGCRTLNQSDAKLNQLLFGYFCSLGILSFSSLNLWRSSSGLISHCDKSSFNLRYLIEKRFLRKCLPLFDNKCWYCNANFLFGLFSFISFLLLCRVHFRFVCSLLQRSCTRWDSNSIFFRSHCEVFSLLQTSPDFFYASVKAEFKLESLFDLLKFTDALEKLDA